MLRLLGYLLKKGIVTRSEIPQFLDDGLSGLPKITSAACRDDCSACVESCPTDAIAIHNGEIQVDRGDCIGCGECIRACPTGTLQNDLSTATFAQSRDSLILGPASSKPVKPILGKSIFNGSLALRVVSTGCSACDLEISAASNPIFDMERFGISIVASPRFADALLITGPVPKAMHGPLLACYRALAAPKIVIACGTCAISGGVHKRGYAEANGVSSLLPVDVFIPGCAPHPWQIIRGLLSARKLQGRSSVL